MDSRFSSVNPICEWWCLDAMERCTLVCLSTTVAIVCCMCGSVLRGNIKDSSMPPNNTQCMIISIYQNAKLSLNA